MVSGAGRGDRRLGIRGVYQYRDNVFLRRDERSRRGEEARADIVQETQKVQEASAQSIVQNQAASGQAVIDYACQFIGNPYVWGGTSLQKERIALDLFSQYMLILELACHVHQVP